MARHSEDTKSPFLSQSITPKNNTTFQKICEFFWNSCKKFVFGEVIAIVVIATVETVVATNQLSLLFIYFTLFLHYYKLSFITTTGTTGTTTGTTGTTGMLPLPFISFKLCLRWKSNPSHCI